MSLANSSHRAAQFRVLLLVLLIAQNLVRSQLTPAPAQICHSFHCFGEMCYKEAKFSNQMAECEPGNHHCERCHSTFLGNPALLPDLGHLTVPEDKLVPTPPAPKRNEKICATSPAKAANASKGRKLWPYALRAWTSVS